MARKDSVTRAGDQDTVESGFHFRIGGDGRLNLSAGGGKWVGNTQLQGATTYHVGVTLGDGQVRFYVNGVLDGQFAFVGNVNDIDTNMLIGRGPNCGMQRCQFFDGNFAGCGALRHRAQRRRHAQPQQ